MVLFIRHVGSIRLLGINHKVISRVKYVAEKIVMVMGMEKYLRGWGGDGVNFFYRVILYTKPYCISVLLNK